MTEFNIQAIESENRVESQPQIQSFEELISFKLTNKLFEFMKTPFSEGASIYNDFKTEYLKIETELLKDDIRILYNMISNNMYVLIDKEKLIVETNIELLEMILCDYYTLKCNLDNDEICKKIKILTKIYDHFMLSLRQKDRMITELGSLKIKLDESKKEFLSIDVKYSELTNKLKIIDDQSKLLDTRLSRINYDVISVLGVFTGISFILFGGVSLISTIGNDSNYNLFFRTIIVGIILLDSIVVLLQYVKSIVKENIRVTNLIYDFEDKKYTKFVYFNVIVGITVLLFLALEYRNTLFLIINDVIVFILPIVINISKFIFSKFWISETYYIPIWSIIPVGITIFFFLYKTQKKSPVKVDE